MTYLVKKERFNEGFMVIKELRGEGAFMCRGSIQCDYSKEHKEILLNIRSDIARLHLLQTEIRLDTEDDEDYCLSSTGRAGGNICTMQRTQVERHSPGVE